MAHPSSLLHFPRLAGFYKKTIKSSMPEEYLEIPSVDSQGRAIRSDKEIPATLKVKKVKLNSKVHEGLNLKKGEEPVPCCATLGPITVVNPEIFSKKYKWCSCGLSTKQVPMSNEALL